MNLIVQRQNVGLLLTEISTKLRKFLGWIGSHEQEQAAIRIAILSSALAFLLANEPDSGAYQSLWLSSVKFISILLILSFGIYGSTILWPGPSHAIRVVGILVDSIGQSYGLYLTGPIGAPLWAWPTTPLRTA